MILDTMLDANGRPVFQAPPKSMRSFTIEHWGVFKGVCDVLPWKSTAPVPVEIYVGKFTELDWKEYFARRIPEIVPFLENLDNKEVMG